MRSPTTASPSSVAELDTEPEPVGEPDSSLAVEALPALAPSSETMAELEVKPVP